MKLPIALLIASGGAVALFAKDLPNTDPEPMPSLRQIVNGMDSTQVQKAIELLQTNFLSPSATDEASRQRALLEGLVARLAPGVAITTAPDPRPAPATFPFLSEVIDGRVGYVRPSRLDANSLSRLDSALSDFATKKVLSVILDLRAVPAEGEFDMAAEFAKRFCPKDKPLFSLRKPGGKEARGFVSDRDAAFEGVLIVLTDFDTAGAAEALAGSLRIGAGAMIVGSDTSGKAVEFREFPLGNGTSLRVAVAEVVLPGNVTIFPGGIKPDVAISIAQSVQSEIFQAATEKGVSQFAFDAGRSHMSEADLVANTNPEIDGSPEGQKDARRSVLKDAVLQRAVDLITAITFYRNSR